MKKSDLRQVLHLFFPTRCPVCGEFIGSNDDFCTKCREKLSENSSNYKIEGADSFTAAFVYDNTSSKAIMLLKNGICGNAAYAFGKALAEALKRSGAAKAADIIIPVPLHKSSLHKRGYNQSELIAKELSEHIGIPVCSKAVVKNRRTAEQKSLSSSERQTNLKGAYSIVNHELVKDKHILLIDDVCTTGSTLRELTDILKENGAKAVHCAVCCKTPPHR